MKETIFNVYLEKNGKVLCYLVNADKIEYTTQTVFLTKDERMVAYFRREYVFSITEKVAELVERKAEELEE